MKTNKAKLKAKADRLFSLAIRLRDCDSNGYGPCITCGTILHFKQGHAGHFQSRRYSSTRYNDENVNLQCAGCNSFRAGEQYKYSLALDLKYGSGTAKKLARLAQKELKLTTEFLEETIADSQEQIKFYESQ